MRARWISAALWIAALAVTILLAGFQRMTGPSHPMRGEVVLADAQTVRYFFPRSNEGGPELRVTLPGPTGTTATLEWRRFPTDEPYRHQTMAPDGSGRLAAAIPRQPAAGKVEYRILLELGDDKISIPATETVVARFRDDVPAGVLVPHILSMFLSMLLSTRALLEVLRRGAPPARGLVLASMALLVVGGLILGPIVQRFAFGAYWTGWPFGDDLTDNKTLFAFLAWLPATVAAWRGARTRIAVAIGWVVMMGVFLIPHSARGSQLDWSTIDQRPTLSSE